MYFQRFNANMSEEMFNGGINVDDIYALLCMNRTNNPCNNTTILMHETHYDEELIATCGYYLEGIALTPISVFGMVGKFFCSRFANFLHHRYTGNNSSPISFHPTI